MRVVHFVYGRCNPDSANGVDKSVYYLARYQAELGISVATFMLTSKEPIPIPGVEVRALHPPLTGWLGTRLPLAPKAVVTELQVWKPDVVHFHSVHIGLFIGLARWLQQWGVPYVVTPHGGFAPGRIERVSVGVRAYMRLLEKRYLERALFVQAVSNNDTAGLRALGIGTRIVEVPNGIDLAAIPRKVGTDFLRRRYPSVAARRLFLFLGRLDPAQKGLDVLLEGFARADTSNSVLFLVGPDWKGSMAWLRSRAEELGIRDRVILTGPAYGQEKWAFLAGVDVFVHTSRWEAGLPFSILEACAMGKPVVASHAADPDGRIGHEGAGVTIPLTVEAICEAISRMEQASTEELARMGRRARRLAESYNWKQIANRLVEAYRRYGV